ncbi:MAG: VanZ family protein [Acidobacteriia bacterium]|nr:VanZ family protein [Terriglobia bacterium]
MLSDRARFGIVTAGVVVLIAYGSLFPFAFHACAPSPATLLATPAILDRGDLLSNILFYMPLGFFAQRAWFGSRKRGASKWSVAATAVAGTALSFAMELTQFCAAGRVPSLGDVWANGAGTLLGAMAAVVAGDRLNAGAMLAAFWVGSRTLPYFPSLHWSKYRDAIRPILHAPARPLEVFHYFGLWLAAAAVIDAVTGSRRARWILPALIGAVFAARVVIVDLSLTPGEVEGALAAVLAWNAIARAAWRDKAVAAIFAIFIVEQALEPFRFLAVPRSFDWIPFYSFMLGPREGASRVFLEKSFMYGSLTWLAARAGVPFSTAAIGATALVFAVRLAQVYLPGRSAEITDAIMVAMFAATLKLTRT